MNAGHLVRRFLRKYHVNLRKNYKLKIPEKIMSAWTRLEPPALRFQLSFWKKPLPKQKKQFANHKSRNFWVPPSTNKMAAFLPTKTNSSVPWKMDGWVGISHPFLLGKAPERPRHANPTVAQPFAVCLSWTKVPKRATFFGCEKIRMYNM